jgi:hypothetical protein
MAERRPSRAVLLIAVDDHLTRCSYCGERVRWATTAKGKKMLLQAKAHVEHTDTGPQVSSDDVHWAHCPHQKRAREVAQQRRGNQQRPQPQAVQPGPTRDDVYPPGRRGPRGSYYAGD